MNQNQTTDTQEIMIIDDEPALLEVTAEGLERDGYVIHAFEDPRDALDVFRVQNESISLVVFDLIMPKLMGPDLARALRAVDPDVKLLAITGCTPQSQHPRAIQALGVQCLFKPVIDDSLQLAITKLLAE